jgi:hypothetical protein
MEDNTIEVINHIQNKNRAAALDLVSDMMDAAASEAIDAYKKVVSNSYFDEPVETLETEQ